MDSQWIVVEIDGKISSVSPDFGFLADIAQKIAKMPVESISRITCRKMATNEIVDLSPKLNWDDLRLFGSKFQLAVWEKLFEITHSDGAASTADTETGGTGAKTKTTPRLLSYSDFADLCGKREGVRAVAHAIAHNPAAIIVPCHLVVPKETIDRLALMHKKTLPSLFEGQSILTDPSLNFGEYRYGTDLKRQLILGSSTR